MSNKIAKTIARQKQKIAEGQYYEAHQQLRVITSRYLKANDYASATDILHSGALLLLGANQPSSGGDLALTLLKDVYLVAPLEVNDANRARLLEILRAFPSDDPLRKRFITEAVSWSVKAPPNNSDDERGDAQLHHEIGSLLAEEGDAYDAERHLLLGLSPQSASPLATVHYKWYTRDNPHTAALYASRSVLPYLILGNLQNATTALAVFTSQLLTSPTGSSIPTQTIESQKSSVRIFPSLPLLNFLSLLLLAAQRADAALFRSLAKHYASHLKEVEDIWGDPLAQIGEIWFGIRLPKQGGNNPLMDMMGSMLFGGGAGAASKQQPRSNNPKPAAKPVEPKPPAAMDLD